MTGPGNGPQILFKRRGQKYDVRLPGYNGQLVAMCKTVPSWARGYDPATKIWTFERQFAESLADDFKKIGCKVLGLEAEEERKRKAPPLPPPPAAVQQKNWAELMLERAEQIDPLLSKALFRALVKVLHSDVGGDHAMMQELNLARKARNEQAEGTG